MTADPLGQDATVVGGKAAALARLAAAGFDIPPWFVLASGEPAGDLAARLSALGEGPYAVRSSAAGEDGAAHSHAGQFLSLLDVPAAEVAEAVARVRASGARASVAEYRRARGIDGDPTPAVIVQRMVRARAAGVAFSADPRTGSRDAALIEAVAGLGDRLVGGEIDGELWLVVRASCAATLQRPVETAVLKEAEAIAVARLAFAVEAASGRPQDIEWALEADRLYLLQARPITSLPSGAPVDDDATLVLDNSNIVESYPGVVAPLTFSFARHVYAHVYRELAALLGIPAAAIERLSVTFDNLLARTSGRVYYNLLNWYRILALLPGFRLNRSHMETMMGVAEALPAEVADALAPPPARGFARLGEWVRIFRVACGLAWQALRLPRTIRSFQFRLDAALAGDPARFDRLPLTALAAEYRRLEAALLRRWDAPLVNDLVCMIAFGTSRKLLERWAGAEGVALHGDVLIGQSDIVSAEPARLVREMGRMLRDAPELLDAFRRGDPELLAGDVPLSAALRAYIDRFGDRCTEELKLESMTLVDDPAPLLKAVAAASLAAGPDRMRHTGLPPSGSGRESRRSRSLVSSWSDLFRPSTPSLRRRKGVDARHKAEHDESGLNAGRATSHAEGHPHSGGQHWDEPAHGGGEGLEARLRTLFRGRPLRRLAARRLLGWSKRRVRDRENLRFERTRLFGRIRRIVRAAGQQLAAHGLLDRADDVFMLTIDELLGAIEGGQASEDLRGLAAVRRAEMDRFAALPDPPERLTFRGAAIVASAMAAPATPPAEGMSRGGLACCSGVARGPARVVRDPRRQAVQPGEILVARHTDPGWIAHFASAAAVVVERGSLLSHSAIVARELGIPCVVGVKGATDWLADGETIVVDGGRGIVSKADGAG